MLVWRPSRRVEVAWFDGWPAFFEKAGTVESDLERGSCGDDVDSQPVRATSVLRMLAVRHGWPRKEGMLAFEVVPDGLKGSPVPPQPPEEALAGRPLRRHRARQRCVLRAQAHALFGRIEVYGRASYLPTRVADEPEIELGLFHLLLR